MRTDSKSRRARSKKRYESSSSSSSSDTEGSERRYSGRRHKSRRRSCHRTRDDSDEEEQSSSKKLRRHRKERRRKERRESRRERRGRASQSGDSSSSGDDSDSSSSKAKSVLRYILKKFPSIGDELKQLLQTVDDGQAVDIRGIPDKSLKKLLKKLFLSLDLEENESGVFLLPQTSRHTMDVVGFQLYAHFRPEEQNVTLAEGGGLPESLPSHLEAGVTNEKGTRQSPEQHIDDGTLASGKRRIIGPAMPSAELLAAAAKLTEAETELREAELDIENDLFIGPPPPALAAEAESVNEAERFEEVTRIMESEADSAYDVLGVNHKMSVDNMKKRYWKLSLMVHPDKCSHPLAHQAFIKLNKAFKELQDPEKKKAIDDKIQAKEELEALQAELRAQREAAQWRRLQGISMEGDDELLAEEKAPQKREEWMTTLPPERKPGMSMHSTTSFSRTGKEGRGDTSVWTDSPSDKTEKAKMNYLEAYNKAKELAALEDKQRKSSDADLVDKYNQSKRSKSLVQKVQEEASTKKRKSKDPPKEEWVGQHPWKPWDRDKDLVAGRKRVNLDSNGMAEGLASRFSAGNFQRNFL